jgi:hypothetical protein
VRFESLHYAQGTPYETLIKKSVDSGERIFPPEVAAAAKSALMGVVNGGTAERVKGVYTDGRGHLLAVGGKTGTGDHRKEVWASGGRLIESKFISRAATFVFFLGERFFGVITAYVEGAEAENYHFTSALPVQILKYLKPTLSPLITGIDKPIADIITAENTAPEIKTIPVVINKPAAIIKPSLPVKAVKPVIKPTPVINNTTQLPKKEKAVTLEPKPSINNAILNIPKPSFIKKVDTKPSPSIAPLPAPAKAIKVKPNNTPPPAPQAKPAINLVQ